MRELTYPTFDGSHNGISDLYPEVAQVLTDALAEGPFAEDWRLSWGSKKEIVSASVEKSLGTGTVPRVTVTVTASNDFDIQGADSMLLSFPVTLEQVIQALDTCWEGAAKEQSSEMGNSLKMFPIAYHGRWMETYLLDVSGEDCDEPPGDYYAQWGWQEETEIPSPTKEAIEAWIHSNDWRADGAEPFTLGDWSVAIPSDD